MTLTYHCLVSGKVQGVGYRRFVQKHAEALGLQGWARNLLDGRVETCAQGDEATLNAFVEKLRQGPVFGRVDEVTVSKVQAAPVLGFEILKDEVVP